MQYCFGVLSFVLQKIRKSNQTLETIKQASWKYAQLAMNTSILTASYQSPHTHTSYVQRGRGNVVVGMVVKYKVCELEEELREGFSKRLMEDLLVCSKYSMVRRGL